MTSPPSILGPYPVERELGRGGMGVVYLGRDPRLGRPVAIKVLPDALATAESLARFDREAKLLASLNHPNIATLYGVEEVDNRRLLVLEYIPGDTLAMRTMRGPLPIGEALDICRQVAGAIEAAHEGGVIHRDLKPGNVKITPDDQVKVLDFGLAKGTAVSDAEMAHSPTVTFAATGMGVILGTAGYMSPEQARGKAVDRRTDTWSFGCVLFECLTGKQTFEGETVSDTIAHIIGRDPDWSALPQGTPTRIREVLRRCLEKDLKKRQRDIGDVRIQLEEAIAERATSSSMAVAAAAATTRSAFSLKSIAAGALLVVVGAAAGIGTWTAIGPRAGYADTGVTRTARASFAVPRTLRAFNAGVTPDGQTLLVGAYGRNADGSEDPVSRIYMRRIDDYRITPVAGTDRVQQSAVSADGKWLAVITPVSEQSTQRQLVRLPIDGSSPPVKIASVGHVVFSRGDTLMAAPFDLARLALTGDVTALSRDLRIAAAWEHGDFTLSRSGTLVFMPGGLVGADRRLVSVDEAGTVTPFGSERRTFEQLPAVSRDGRRIAVVLASDRGNYEAWTAERDRPVLRRALSLPSADCFLPTWSPDGQRLAFSRYAQDKDDGVYVQNADGSGTAQLVMRSDGAGSFVTASSWERDGTGLLVTKIDRGKPGIHHVDVVAGAGALAKARALRTTTYADFNGTLSPDGRFIAFESNESGKFEIYVALWSADGLAGRPLMVSGGGSASLLGPGGVGIGWAGDSRRLFFGTPERKVMSVTVDARAALTASKPVVVHDLKKLRASGWNVLPNGGLLAIQRSEAEEDTSTFSVVFNWFEELRARMGNR